MGRPVGIGMSALVVVMYGWADIAAAVEKLPPRGESWIDVSYVRWAPTREISLGDPIASSTLEIPAPRPGCARKGGMDMPDLRSLFLLTEPTVRTGGSAIKGLYFAHSHDGPNDLIAFWLACSGTLEPRPFLSFEFATGIYLLDSDRDGCADQSGVVPTGAIDPADFLESLPNRRWCPQVPVGEPV